MQYATAVIAIPVYSGIFIDRPKPDTKQRIFKQRQQRKAGVNYDRYCAGMKL